MIKYELMTKLRHNINIDVQRKQETWTSLCPDIWIKLKETSSALGGIFGVLYIQSSETLWLLDKDISFL